MSLLRKFLELDVNLEEINIAWTSKEGEKHYESTPIGAYVFAGTGCDGVSFCIVPRNGDKTLENSPVYTLSPMDFSEGTVVWTARNFHDYLRLTLLCKTAWCSLIYAYSADEFDSFIRERKDEISDFNKSGRNKLKSALKSIESILPKSKTKYDYNYFMDCYNNRDNHMDLSFGATVEMRSYNVGCYCHND